MGPGSPLVLTCTGCCGSPSPSTCNVESKWALQSMRGAGLRWPHHARRPGQEQGSRRRQTAGGRNSSLRQAGTGLAPCLDASPLDGAKRDWLPPRGSAKPSVPPALVTARCQMGRRRHRITWRMADVDGNATAGGIAGRWGGAPSVGACGRLEERASALRKLRRGQCSLSEGWRNGESGQECKCRSGTSACDHISQSPTWTFCLCTCIILC